MENNITNDADRARQEGVAKRVLRASGIEFTGERLDASGVTVRETATEAATRMIGDIQAHNPGGLALLQEAGVTIEV